MSQVIALSAMAAPRPPAEVDHAARLREVVLRREEVLRWPSERVRAELDVAAALERWKGHLAVQFEARRAARVLETALGEALGPAEIGRPRAGENPPRVEGLSEQDRGRFRLMAAHRALWWPMLDAAAPSRAAVLRRISEMTRPPLVAPEAAHESEDVSPAPTLPEVERIDPETGEVIERDLTAAEIDAVFAPLIGIMRVSWFSGSLLDPDEGDAFDWAAQAVLRAGPDAVRSVERALAVLTRLKQEIDREQEREG